MPASLPLLPWQASDQPRPLSARIAADTARRIIERDLTPGTLLTEVELAAASEASRTPAREAMVQLSTWGLVRLVPKKGAIVGVIDPEQRRDLLHLRVLLESDAIATLSTMPARLDQLHDTLRIALDQQQHAVAVQDPLAFASADVAFHFSIVAAAGNGVITSVLERLTPQLARLTYEVAINAPELLPDLRAEHERLATLAAAGDAVAFAALETTHLQHSRTGRTDRP